MNDLNLTIVGNLTDQGTLSYTPKGTAVCNFRVGHTPRTRGEDGSWRDGEPTFLDCTAWRQLAESMAELPKGTRVIVAGRLRTERWTGKDGEQRSKLVMDVDAAGPELSFASAKVTKLRRGNGAGDDEWANATRTRPAGSNGERTDG
jgi:single-strand DNA-binding protein